MSIGKINKATDIVTRLRDIDCNRGDVYEAADEIERLRKERDEARRLYCIAFQEITENLGENNTIESIAEEMGWDCYKNYKEDTND